MTRHAAQTIHLRPQALTAAIANGVNNHGLDQERMVVGLAYVGRGTPLPRIDFRARGKSGSKDRARAHLTAREGLAVFPLLCLCLCCGRACVCVLPLDAFPLPRPSPSHTPFLEL